MPTVRPGLRPLLPALFLPLFAEAENAEATRLWQTRIQPLLDQHCVKCHGPIEQKASLELDTLPALLKGGESGPVVKPRHPDSSLLYTVLSEGSDPHMPPKKQLSVADRALLRDWIALLPEALPDAPKSASSRDFSGIPEAINTLVGEGWARLAISPSAPLEDSAWLRRVYLDLAGRIPTPAEEVAFAAQPRSARREQIVQHLLGSSDYPVRMRELWDYFLMGRPKRGTSEERRKQSGWHGFLERVFQNNQPWPHTVHQIITARADRPETKGSTWFLYERKNDHQSIAEAVGPLIYGTRVDCAQCHDHPLAREIKQAHYWGLVTAFNRSKNVEGSSGVAESAVGGFVNFTNLKKESQPALITLLNGRTVSENWPAGDHKSEDKDELYADPKAKIRVPLYSRREAFADVATDNNALLAKAFVNRMWSVLLGRGIVHPADEMNARNAPSHPELLEWLARDFAAHDYDVKRLLAGIVLSAPYALSAGDSDAAAFAAAPERPLTAEQLARSWRIVAGLPPEHEPLRKAAQTAIPEVLPKDYNATFQQAQFLSHSPLIRELFESPENPTITRLSGIPENSECVCAAFLAALGRLPVPVEKEKFVAFLNASSNDRTRALREILHALITCPEFLVAPR